MSSVAGHADLSAAARLFGRLLVRELDTETLEELSRPAVRASLRELGIECPSASLEELAAQYCARFVHPRIGYPPVQSLWTTGQYDGAAALAVRAIADASAREPAPGARNAAPDHIGCILLLWAELVHERPELAERLRRDHLQWAQQALAETARDDDFFGSIATATIELLRRLTE